MTRYFGQYNWYGEIHKLWTHASYISMAHKNFINQLSKRIDTSKYRLRQYFNTGKNNFKILEKEKEK